jgi:hypothetical protein
MENGQTDGNVYSDLRQGTTIEENEKRPIRLSLADIEDAIPAPYFVVGRLRASMSVAEVAPTTLDTMAVPVGNTLDWVTVIIIAHFYSSGSQEFVKD